MGFIFLSGFGFKGFFFWGGDISTTATQVCLVLTPPSQKYQFELTAQENTFMVTKDSKSGIRARGEVQEHKKHI